MKKLIFPLLLMTILVSSCMPGLSQPAGLATPDATMVELAGTLAAQTLIAQVPPTFEIPPTETPTPVLPATETTIATDPGSTATGTLDPAATETTLTVTPPANGTITATANSTPTQTATSSTSPISIYTLSPGTQYGTLNLQNKAKTEVYVSLQCTTPRGEITIMEQFVPRGTATIKAPLGWYTYVAYIGGNKVVGQFKLGSPSKMTLVFTKDKVSVR